MKPVEYTINKKKIRFYVTLYGHRLLVVICNEQNISEMKCFKFSCSYEVFFFVFVYLKHIFHSIIVALLTVSVFCYHSVTTTCFTDLLVHSLCDINNKYILLPQYRFIVIDLIRTNLIVYQKITKKAQTQLLTTYEVLFLH